MVYTAYHSCQDHCGLSGNNKSRSIGEKIIGKKKKDKAKSVLASNRKLDFLQQCFEDARAVKGRNMGD